MTELVSGLDIVREQFWLARGAPLSERAIEAAGRAAVPASHAIEVRVSAEDPAREFAPAPGRVGRWVMPAGPGVRVDTAVEPGERIPPDYDPLVAKLMVHAGDRPSAIERLRRALDETEIGGIQTTLPFDRFVVRDPSFIAGELSTGWVPERWDGPAERASAVRRALLTAGLAAIADGEQAPSGATLGLGPIGRVATAGRDGTGHAGTVALADRRPGRLERSMAGMTKPAAGGRAGVRPTPRTRAATKPETTVDGPIDPRAVRVAVAAPNRAEGDPIMTVSPPPLPVLRPVGHLAGTAILGGIPSPPDATPAGDGRRARRARTAPPGRRLRRGRRRGHPGGRGRSPARPVGHGRRSTGRRRPGAARPGARRARRAVPEGSTRSRVTLGREKRRETDGLLVRELVIDGWRVEVELEPERRASLRERARRGSDVAGRGGPVEVRAIIPGRIVALSVDPGDPVTAGQQVLVLEAMKMQNELLAPREGTIERIAIAVGETVEVGDLLLVIT